MEDKMQKTLWIAHQLFERQLVTGSAGNISFRDGELIYISQSGTNLGQLTAASFAQLKLSGEIISGKPSKEYPLHLALYQASLDNQAVIHTHSFYSTLISCLKDQPQTISGLFAYTPYLAMKTGRKVGSITYYQPGSSALFEAFNAVADRTIQAYLLGNHGVVITAQTIADAFNLLEEFEMSARIFWTINGFKTGDCSVIPQEDGVKAIV